jgi:hypothetical protein
MSRTRQLLFRLAFALAVAGVAVICLSSVLLAAVTGVVTTLIVAVDMFAFSRSTPMPRPGSEPPDPEKLSVDLSRRQ